MMAELAVSVLLMGWGTLRVARQGAACTMAEAGSEAPCEGGPAPTCMGPWPKACTGSTWGCAAGIRPCSPTPLAMLHPPLAAVADAVTAVGGEGEYPVTMLLSVDDGVGM